MKAKRHYIKLTPVQRQELIRQIQAGVAWDTLMTNFRVSRSTIYFYKDKIYGKNPAGKVKKKYMKTKKSAKAAKLGVWKVEEASASNQEMLGEERLASTETKPKPKDLTTPTAKAGSSSAQPKPSGSDLTQLDSKPLEPPPSQLTQTPLRSQAQRAAALRANVEIRLDNEFLEDPPPPKTRPWGKRGKRRRIASPVSSEFPVPAPLPMSIIPISTPITGKKGGRRAKAIRGKALRGGRGRGRGGRGKGGKRTSQAIGLNKTDTPTNSQIVGEGIPCLQFEQTPPGGVTPVTYSRLSSYSHGGNYSGSSEFRLAENQFETMTVDCSIPEAFVLENNRGSGNVQARDPLNAGFSPLSSKSANQLHVQHNYHSRRVLEALVNDEAFVDVTLTAEGRPISAHKLVLSAMSPYFQRVLQANPCRHPVVIMPPSVSFTHLSHIISFMYKGETTVLESELRSLIRTAELLQVSGFKLPGQAPFTEDSPASSSSFSGFSNPQPPTVDDRVIRITEEREASDEEGYRAGNHTLPPRTTVNHTSPLRRATPATTYTGQAPTATPSLNTPSHSHSYTLANPNTFFLNPSTNAVIIKGRTGGSIIPAASAPIAPRGSPNSRSYPHRFPGTPGRQPGEGKSGRMHSSPDSLSGDGAVLGVDLDIDIIKEEIPNEEEEVNTVFVMEDWSPPQSQTSPLQTSPPRTIYAPPSLPNPLSIMPPTAATLTTGAHLSIVTTPVPYAITPASATTASPDTIASPCTLTPMMPDVVLPPSVITPTRTAMTPQPMEITPPTTATTPSPNDITLPSLTTSPPAPEMTPPNSSTPPFATPAMLHVPATLLFSTVASPTTATPPPTTATATPSPTTAVSPPITSPPPHIENSSPPIVNSPPPIASPPPPIASPPLPTASPPPPPTVSPPPAVSPPTASPQPPTTIMEPIATTPLPSATAVTPTPSQSPPSVAPLSPTSNGSPPTPPSPTSMSPLSTPPPPIASPPLPTTIIPSAIHPTTTPSHYPLLDLTTTRSSQLDSGMLSIAPSKFLFNATQTSSSTAHLSSLQPAISTLFPTTQLATNTPLLSSFTPLLSGTTPLLSSSTPLLSNTLFSTAMPLMTASPLTSTVPTILPVIQSQEVDVTPITLCPHNPLLDLTTSRQSQSPLLSATPPAAPSPNTTTFTSDSSLDDIATHHSSDRFTASLTTTTTTTYTYNPLVTTSPATITPITSVALHRPISAVPLSRLAQNTLFDVRSTHNQNNPQITSASRVLTPPPSHTPHTTTTTSVAHNRLFEVTVASNSLDTQLTVAAPTATLVDDDSASLSFTSSSHYLGSHPSASTLASEPVDWHTFQRSVTLYDLDSHAPVTPLPTRTPISHDPLFDVPVTSHNLYGFPSTGQSTTTPDTFNPIYFQPPGASHSFDMFPSSTYYNLESSNSPLPPVTSPVNYDLPDLHPPVTSHLFYSHSFPPPTTTVAQSIPPSLQPLVSSQCLYDQPRQTPTPGSQSPFFLERAGTTQTLDSPPTTSSVNHDPITYALKEWRK